MLLTCRLVR